MVALQTAKKAFATSAILCVLITQPGISELIKPYAPEAGAQNILAQNACPGGGTATIIRLNPVMFGGFNSPPNYGNTCSLGPILISSNLIAGDIVTLNSVSGNVCPRVFPRSQSCLDSEAYGCQNENGNALLSCATDTSFSKLGFFGTSGLIAEFPIGSFNNGILIPEGANALYGYVRDGSNDYFDNNGAYKCTVQVSLSSCTSTCNDQQDNNNNGVADCADPACHTDGIVHPGNVNLTCNPNGPENPYSPRCGDGLRFGSEVCDESDGINGTAGHCNATCSGPTTSTCNDQQDNNNNGVADCADPACHTDGIVHPGNVNLTCNPNGPENPYSPRCGDGLRFGSEVCDESDGVNGTAGHCNATCTGFSDPNPKAIFVVPTLIPVGTTVTAIGSPWQNNNGHIADVNNSGLVSPIDSLTIINAINNIGGQPIELSDPNPSDRIPAAPYMDVNGNGFVTEQDIQEVNSLLNGGTAHSVSFDWTVTYENGSVVQTVASGTNKSLVFTPINATANDQAKFYRVRFTIRDAQGRTAMSEKIVETTSTCADQVDNNNNGVADCADPACHFDGIIHPENVNLTCNPNGPENPYTPRCGDGLRYGSEICDESDGINGTAGHCNTTCSGQTTPTCRDTADNNQNGVSDCADPACHTDGIVHPGNVNLTCNLNGPENPYTPRCGDGLRFGSEVCDESDGINGTAGHCNATCSGPTTQTADIAFFAIADSIVERPGTNHVRIFVTNNGPASTNVTVTAAIPAGTDFDATTSYSPCMVSISNTQLACTIPALSPNRNAPIEIDLNFVAPTIPACLNTDVQTRITVNGALADSNPADNQPVMLTTSLVCPVPQLGCIDVVKETYDTNNNVLAPVPQFTFTLDGKTQDVNDSSGLARFVYVPLGSHTVTEASESAWQQLSVTPTGGTVTVDHVVFSGIHTNAVVVGSNQCARVVFKNKQIITSSSSSTSSITSSSSSSSSSVTPTLGCIEVIKEAYNTAGAPINPVPQFTFSVNGQTQGYTDGTGHAFFVNIPVGWHTVQEVVPATWTQLSVTPSNGTVFVGGGNQCGVVVVKNRQVITSSTSSSSSVTSSSSSSSSSVTPTVGCIEVIKEAYTTTGAPITPVPQFTFTVDNQTQGLTDATGHALFANVAIGWHNVQEVIPATWTQLSVTPASGTVYVGGGNQCGVLVVKNKQVISGTPTFTITKTDGKTTVQIGDVLVYQITVTNTSSVNATNVVVTDVLPSNVTFVNSDGTRSGNQVTWTLASLAAGTTSSPLTVVMTVPSGLSDGTVITNVATVGSSYVTDIDTVGSSSTTCNVGITMSQYPQSWLNINDLVTYTMNVTNNSSTVLSNFTITQSLDSNTTFQNASNNGTNDYGGNTVRWTGLSLGANSSMTLTTTVRVKSNTQGALISSSVYGCNGQSSQSARVNGDNNNYYAYNSYDRYNRNDTIPPVAPPPPAGNTNGLSIVKQADRAEAQPGSVLSYTVIVKNASDIATGPVNVTDTFNASDIQSVVDSGGGTPGGGSIQWNLGTLNGNVTRLLHYTVRLNSSLQQGYTVSNSVRIDGSSASASADVRIIKNFPQTGLLTAFMNAPVQKEQYLQPVAPKKRVTEEQNADATFPLTIWTLIGSFGLMGGGLLGKKFLFAI